MSMKSFKSSRKFTPTKVKQGGSELYDINAIVARFIKTGQIPLRAAPPVYGALKTPGSLQAALDLGIQVKEAFASLPSALRQEMRNDPRNLETWLRDPRNTDLAIQHGLLEPKPKPTPTPTPPAPITPTPTPEPKPNPTGGQSTP